MKPSSCDGSSYGEAHEAFVPRTCSLHMEEIWASRNFLLEQYAEHERSRESVEGAFEKLLMLVSSQGRGLRSISKQDGYCVEKTLLVCVHGWLEIINSAEGGPAFQVAVSLAACIYFFNEKTESLGRARLIGIGALTAGWFCGSLTIPMIPTVFINPTWTLELLTSLVAYAFLFLSCTFLK
ncbi:hypothetical protein F2Q68_00012419 [Brassica cretica]|uniref:Protein CHAPERONE-LIKE PROTEIN OF POR1, chloroplastic n=1 Tax=Brassica cretica TaxID=69181 RepID=A0A8S9KYZ6_BRACR|nr:hypothetical protein F2Q68_00012419 [Brassica cretica]